MDSLFRNPWLLVALAALLLPLVIEWLFRRRKRQVELPTIRFLLDNQAQKKVKRQDRILLLLRTFAIVLVVFALSRPLLQRGWVGAAKERNVVLLLDGTASMNQQRDVTTAFAMAQKKAAAVIRALPAGTSVTVAKLGHRVELIVERETDLHTAAARVEGLRATSGAASMDQGLAWVKEILAEDSSEGAELYVFSDFQKQTWQRGADEALATSQAMRDIEANCETFLIDVGGNAEFNYVVSLLRPEEYAMSAGMPVKFQAMVECLGTPPEGAEAAVTFLVDGVKKDVREIAPGAQAAAIEFEYRFPSADEFLVEVAVEGDSHRIDNRRMYLCQIPQDVRVLILDEGAEGAGEPASVFLARAIRPPTHAAMEKVSHFDVRTIIPARISYENLRDYAAIVLTGTSQLNAALAGQLEAYVAEGGSLWMFMDESVNLYDYNRFLYRDGEGALPAALAEKVVVGVEGDGGKPVFASYGESSHPALAQLTRLAGDEQAAVARYVRLDAGKMSEQARVIVPLSNGEPLIVERAYGRGRAILVTTTAGVDWTRLPAVAQFAILVQELLRYVVGNPDADVNLNVGDLFRQPVFVSAQHLLLRYPDGGKDRLLPTRSGEDEQAYTLLFDRTTQQGLYEIETIEEILPRRRFVVNQSPAEADLTRLDRADFAEAFPSGGWTWIGPQTAIEDLAAELHTVTELSPWIFWALGAMLATETFLAWRFGRRRGEASA